jgi:hypothetical protein
MTSADISGAGEGAYFPIYRPPDVKLVAVDDYWVSVIPIKPQIADDKTDKGT